MLHAHVLSSNGRGAALFPAVMPCLRLQGDSRAARRLPLRVHAAASVRGRDCALQRTQRVSRQVCACRCAAAGACCTEPRTDCCGYRTSGCSMQTLTRACRQLFAAQALTLPVLTHGVRQTVMGDGHPKTATSAMIAPCSTIQETEARMPPQAARRCRFTGTSWRRWCRCGSTWPCASAATRP